MLIEQNERRRQREAEMSESEMREFLIEKIDSQETNANMLQDPELKSGEVRKVNIVEKPASDGPPNRKVQHDKPQDPKLMQHTTEEGSKSSEIAPAEAKTEPVIPTLVLQDEQPDEVAEVAEGSQVESEGGIEFAVPTLVVQDESNVGQSQNNAADDHGEHSLPPEVASVTKSTTGTQTSPRDDTDAEQQHDSSQEGSFDDSVIDT